MPYSHANRPHFNCFCHVVKTACSCLDCGSSDNRINIFRQFYISKTAKILSALYQVLPPIWKKATKRIDCFHVTSHMHQASSVKATQWCRLKGCFVFSPSLKSNNEGKIKKVEYLSVAAVCRRSGPRVEQLCC